MAETSRITAKTAAFTCPARKKDVIAHLEIEIQPKFSSAPDELTVSLDDATVTGMRVSHQCGPAPTPR